MEENAATYDLIQDCLEGVADDETVQAHEAEVLKQRRFNDELLLACQDLIHADQVWYMGGKLIDKAKVLQSLEVMSGTYAKQSSNASSKNTKTSGKPSKRCMSKPSCRY